MLRVLVILLAINLILVGFILASQKPTKQKVAWSTVLLVIPVIGLAIYYLFINKRGGRS